VYKRRIEIESISLRPHHKLASRPCDPINQAYAAEEMRTSLHQEAILQKKCGLRIKRQFYPFIVTAAAVAVVAVVAVVAIVDTGHSALRARALTSKIPIRFLSMLEPRS
jgi:hypothetical protein